MASQRFWRLVKFSLPIGIILLISAYLFTNSNSTYNLHNQAWGYEGQETVVGSDLSEGDAALRKEDFIQKATEWDVDGPFNNTALQRTCKNTKWVEGLHFRCASSFGGIGNVRNIILTCVRYAIEAGATTILMPDIEVRGADLSYLETGNIVPFTYMFDTEFFNSSLTTACPQITLVTEEAERAKYPTITTANLTAKDLGKEFKVIRVVDFLPEWRGLFDKWVKVWGAPKGFSASEPLLVNLQAAWMEFPILYDADDFVATFGRIVRFNHDLRRLGAVVLYALDKKYKLDIDPAAEGIPAPSKFYGAHLRTDVDAIKASFASYEEQSAAYLSGAKEHDLSFIYLASGSAGDIKRFTKDAKKKKMSVTTKYALLEGSKEFKADLEEMKKLTWDQQALVDFSMLLRSSVFGGTWASSFAYNIAFQRHVAVCEGGWTNSQSALDVRRDPVKEEKRDVESGGSEVEVEVEGRVVELARRQKEEGRELKKGEVWKDKISTIYGPPKTGIWFELSMYP